MDRSDADQPFLIGTSYLQFCPERARLGEIYADAASEFAEAASDYASAVQFRVRRDWTHVEAIGRRAREARLALQKHRRQHGC